MSEPIYRTVFHVEVFSEGPFVPNGGDNDPFDLAEINYAIYQGDWIGAVTTASSEIVAPDALRGHLERIGNDGTFFDRDDGDDDGDDAERDERVD